MGWLQNKLGAWATDTQSREINEFISRLRPLDSHELATIVAMATDRRHHAFANFGWTLLEPAFAEAAEPTLAVKLVQIIKSLQRDGKPEVAVGYFVWLHTVRAASNPDLRQAGRDMWRQLARGFPMVPEAARDFAHLTGIDLAIDGYGEFPSGLSPDPR